MFKSSGKDYPINIDMSTYIKPFEAERYLFLLDAPETSSHVFFPSILLSDGREISSKSKQISLFRMKDRRPGIFVLNAYHKVVNVENNDYLNMRNFPGTQGVIVAKIPHDAQNVILRIEEIS